MAFFVRCNNASYKKAGYFNNTKLAQTTENPSSLHSIYHPFLQASFR